MSESKRARRPGRAPALASILALVAGACEGEEAGRALLPVERLAFVLPGQGRTLGRAHFAAERALLVDRFETTRGDWKAAKQDQTGLAPEFQGGWDGATDPWPATGINLEEARAFAAGRGMRLPTVSEWMWIASGPRAQPWPWDTTYQDSAANTSHLGLGRLAPVGTFSTGETPSTVHDLIGNVWEWVEPPLPGTAGVSDPRDPMGVLLPYSTGAIVLPTYPKVDGGSPHKRWAMGGSYLYPPQELYGFDRRGRLTFFAQGLDPEHRSNDLGLRCVADAEQFLAQHAEEWSRPAYKKRLVAVGRSRSWRRRSVSLLEELAGRPGAPAAIAWLLEGARE